MNPLHRALGICIILLIWIPFCAQNCYNADFESGNASGYRTFTGRIDRDGGVYIDTERLSPNQHVVTRVGDDFDPIAAAYCIINKELPTVPPVGGRYAMRLGNEESGGNAERVLLTFTVTELTSFFLLRYAVVLEDPDHDSYEQPRFELSILDRNGNPYPCGAYAVRAGRDIPGFENCGDWRIRPWTSVGIELQSFLGEEIQIEILTTDCSRGGHAGYAYFDATCSPLEIELFNYCSDSSTAIMQVTTGFTEYKWSTGDSTSSIEIENPNVGEIYYVTVTSATGCDLVLSDTIPRIEVVEAPAFGPATETQLCTDTTFWFRPPGTNLNRIYSPDIGLFLDSFLIQTEYRNEYTFVSYSDYGCGLDTVVHTFHPLPSVEAEIKDASCFSTADGQIILSTSLPGYEYTYTWEDGSQDFQKDNLAPNIYKVSISDQFGCEQVQQFIVGAPRAIQTSMNVVNETICEGEENGSARFFPNGGVFPYKISYDSAEVFTNNFSYDAFKVGLNLVIIEDNNGCRDSLEVEFISKEAPPEPSFSVLVDSCGQGFSRVEADVIDGPNGPYSYALGNRSFQANPNFNNVLPGEYLLSVRDNSNCFSETLVIVEQLPIFEIQDLIVNDPPCNEQFGNAEIVASSDFGNLYTINNQAYQNTNLYENLGEGNYIAYVKNKFGCIDSLPFDIDGPFEINQTINIYNACPGENDSTLVSLEFGIPPFEYSLDGLNFQSEPLFLNVPPGEQMMYVRDKRNCIVSKSFLMESFDALQIGEVVYSDPDCGADNGSISIELSGGYGQTSLNYNGELFYNEGVFDNLRHGTYAFLIEDESNCSEEVLVNLNANCQLFIPNVFSPNGDGINDLFQIFSNDQSVSIVNTYEIYDRWGSQIFANSNFDINDRNAWWDGSKNGKIFQSGVFVYQIKMTFDDGQTVEKSGSITLVR